MSATAAVPRGKGMQCAAASPSLVVLSRKNVGSPQTLLTLKSIVGPSRTSWRTSVSKPRREKKPQSNFTSSYFTSKTVTSSQLVTLLAFPPPHWA